MERARFYDGRQATPFDALLEISESAIRIRNAADQSLLADWNAETLVVITRPTGGLPGTLSARADDDARLVVSEAVWNAGIAALLQQHKRLRQGPGIATWAAIGVACVMLVIVCTVYSPKALDVLARHVPEPWEEQIGVYSARALAEGEACTVNPIADAALKRFLKSVDAKHHDFSVTVTRDDDINALTVPGHNIVILQGLLVQVKTQGQLAGVLSHETGHAYYRHPLRSLVASMGARLLLGMLTGNAGIAGDAANAANQVLMLGNNRDFESQADFYGVKAMEHLGQDPRELGTFLKAMPAAGIDGQIPEWLLTHPNTENRVKAIQKELADHPPALRTGPPAPLFSDTEWKAIQHYCGDSKTPAPTKPDTGMIQKK